MSNAQPTTPHVISVQVTEQGIVLSAFEAPPKLSEAELDQARQVFAAGRLIARRKAPYFRSILLRFVVREFLEPTPGFWTIGATMSLIMAWCPHFILGKLPASWFASGKAPPPVTPEQMGGLLLHECLHVLNKHGKRRGAREPKRWNDAGDLSINPTVKALGAELPPGGWWPAEHGFLEDQTADVYYTLLEKQEQQGGGSGQGQGSGKKGKSGSGSPGKRPGQPGGGGGRGQKGQSQGGSSGDPGDGEGDGSPGDGDGQGGGQSAPQPGHGWCGSCAGRPFPGEPSADDPEGRSESEAERAVKEAAEQIQQAAQRGRGTVPLGLVRLAEDALQPPKVPWQAKLGKSIRSCVAWAAGAVDHRYDGPSRRQAGLGFGPGKPVLPRLRRPIPQMKVVVDTSGSMGPEELGRAVSETSGVVKATGAPVDFMVADAAVQGVTKVASAEDALRSLKGGGGTLFQPVFDALDKDRPRPEVVVFITDGGCFDKPVEPKGMRVIWVLVGSHRERPVEWGEIVEVDEDDARPEADDD